jgi:hypothetical protein
MGICFFETKIWQKGDWLSIRKFIPDLMGILKLREVNAKSLTFGNDNA